MAERTPILQALETLSKPTPAVQLLHRNAILARRMNRESERDER